MNYRLCYYRRGISVYTPNNMDEHRIHEIELLLLKRLEGDLSGPEAERLESWAAESAENRRLLDALADPEWISDQLAEMDAIPLPAVTSRPVAPVRRMRTIRRMGWAAAVAGLLAAGAGIWLMNRAPVKTLPPVAEAPLRHDVQPGHEGAVLTLADGSTIPLDSATQGEIARQGGSRLTLGNVQLVYDAGEADAAETYNTVTIPRGRQFRLLLPDGSKVWLNSASSIRFLWRSPAACGRSWYLEKHTSKWHSGPICPLSYT